MLIDCHAHLSDHRFDKDRDEIIRNLNRDGIKKVITSGGDLESNAAALLLAEQYDAIYASVGINCGRQNDYNLIDSIKIYLNSKKVSAVGEIGLDYHHFPDEKEIQKKCFIKQIKIASEANLPIVVHDRDANYDTFEIIKNAKKEYSTLRGFLHCYSGDLELAREYINLGFLLSIAGPVTYKNAFKLKEVVKNMPLEYLLTETDSPCLPPSHIGRRRNEPSYVNYTAAAIAELKGTTVETVAKQTSNNARALLRLD